MLFCFGINLICSTPAKQNKTAAREKVASKAKGFNIRNKIELQLATIMLQDRTNSNVQDLPMLNQPECEANQALLDLKPVA